MGQHSLNLTGSEQVPVTGPLKHGNEPRPSIKRGESD
jgi:hypothetical protein